LLVTTKDVGNQVRAPEIQTENKPLVNVVPGRIGDTL
jgi:hypothetical protein